MTKERDIGLSAGLCFGAFALVVNWAWNAATDGEAVVYFLGALFVFLIGLHQATRPLEAEEDR